MVTATFLTEDSYLGSLTEPLTLNRYNYCVSSYLNYTDSSGNEVEVLESLKGWIIDPNTQAQKTIENYENQRLSIEDAIESGLLNNRAGQIFLDYGDIVMGPAVKTPADIIVIRETVKGNSDSKEMQRTATAGFYAGFVGQGIEYTQIISKADYQLSMIITSAKGVNSINNPLSYLLFIKDFSLTQTIDAAKAGLQDAWNGTYDSAIGRKIGAGTFNYLLMTIGGALLKGKGTACEAVESGSSSGYRVNDSRRNHILEGEGPTDPGHGPNRGFTEGAFPDTWTDEQVISAIEDVANNPNSTWKQSTGPGAANAPITVGTPDVNAPSMTNKGTPVRFMVKGRNHGLNITVIVEPHGEGIITGYNSGR